MYLRKSPLIKFCLQFSCSSCDACVGEHCIKANGNQYEFYDNYRSGWTTLTFHAERTRLGREALKQYQKEQREKARGGQ
jgi:hypothetical protein